jgi:hypothetical protein
VNPLSSCWAAEVVHYLGAVMATHTRGQEWIEEVVHPDVSVLLPVLVPRYLSYVEAVALSILHHCIRIRLFCDCVAVTVKPCP